MTGRVIEQVRSDGSARIEAFGTNVFLADDFVEEHKIGPMPFLANEIYERTLRGESPLLNRRQIAEANWKGGLNLFILHYCQRHPSATNVPFEDVLTVAHAAFRETTEGYDLNRLWQEAFFAKEVEFTMSGGMRVICDYPDFSDEIQVGDTKIRPCLMGFTRDDASKCLPGMTVTFPFKSRPPIFYFTPTQQRVLELALEGKSDAEISEQLAVSPDAVKQHWRGIYARIQDSAITRVENGEGTSNHRRRRMLLDYLRTHPEELRPLGRRPRRLISKR